MTEKPILVTGATGKLGRLIVERLVQLQRPVRILTRRPDAAKDLFGSAVDIVAGDFDDAASVGIATRGIGRLLLLSPIGDRLAAHQIAVAEAAALAGCARIVKISGSDWTIKPPGNSISGDAHSAVEQRLTELSAESVSLRPNAWMQVSLHNTIRQVLNGHEIAALNPSAAVGYIDARDIADVSVHQLLADRVAGEVLILAGSAVVSPREIAALLSRLLGRPVGVVKKPALPTSEDVDFEHRAVAQFASLIAAGRAAMTTNTVFDLLGRKPRTIETFIAETLAAETAQAG